ncbi:hypothetical protein G0A00_15595 [Yangia sp. PrR002]|nr:hypothetical protein [Salipiger sp. PrR002]
MAWIVAQLVQNALRMLAVVAGIFFLGGWAWFAYFAGREAEARSLPMAGAGLHTQGGGTGAGPSSADEDMLAGKLFGGLLPIEAVLASKAYADAMDGGCTYAIIRTGGGIAQTPPTSGVGSAWWERFGGDWRQTPSIGTGREPLDACSGEWDGALTEELRQALDAPGNWYMRDGVGTDLHIYSATDRIAARIRYGD